MKYPKKYLTTNPNVMKREINKHKDKADDDDAIFIKVKIFVLLRDYASNAINFLE